MRLVLGVDGGNTKTVALLSTLDGTIVGGGRGGCADIYNAPTPEAALAEIQHAVQEALREAGATADQIIGAVFSTAGADWPEDFVFLRQNMEERGFGRRITVVNDALGALRAGSPDGTGVIIACGTGAALGARSATGQSWLDDLGSSALGWHALHHVYRAELGIEPCTVMRERILAFYELETVEQLLHKFTSRAGTHPLNAARLARIVMDAAEDGDAAARGMVDEHGRSLGDYAIVAARRVDIAHRPFSLVLTGGLFRHHSRLLIDAIVARVRGEYPEAEPVPSRFEPVAGAVLMALEAEAAEINEETLARLASGMPPSAFFVT